MNLSELEELYDKDYFVGRIKSNYNDYYYCKDALENMGSMIEEYMPRFDSLFDAGCAYGHLIGYFRYKVRKVTGCDCSKWAVFFCEEAYQASIDDIPEEDNSYDVVTCFEVLEHIPEQYVDKVISELYRVAKKYVVVIVAVKGWPNPPSDEVDLDVTHHTMKSIDWWNDKFSKYRICQDLIDRFDSDNCSIGMKWTGRFFVLEKE